jgi:hypothetical protein
MSAPAFAHTVLLAEAGELNLCLFHLHGRGAADHAAPGFFIQTGSWGRARY